MSDDLTGRRIGHYLVDGVIGKGARSVLYRATDVRLGRKVALKVIAEHLSGDLEFRERFVDEARNTSAIDHSHRGRSRREVGDSVVPGRRGSLHSTGASAKHGIGTQPLRVPMQQH